MPSLLVVSGHHCWMSNLPVRLRIRGEVEVGWGDTVSLLWRTARQSVFEQQNPALTDKVSHSTFVQRARYYIPSLSWVPNYSYSL